MSSRPPNGMVNSGIGNSGLLITRTLHRRKHHLTKGLFQQTLPIAPQFMFAFPSSQNTFLKRPYSKEHNCQNKHPGAVNEFLR
jgi:hypothetical protein